MYEFRERDWKLLRKKVPEWQERYMDGLVEKYKTILNSDKHSSEKYWELSERLKKDRRNSGVLIEDMSRSHMTYILMDLIRDGVITLDDLKDFTPELQELLKRVTEWWWILRMQKIRHFFVL